MLKHLSIIFVTTSILFLYVEITNPISKAIFYTFIHGLQDNYLWCFYEIAREPYTEKFLVYNKYAEDYWWYFCIGIDQMLHLVLLFALYNL